MERNHVFTKKHGLTATINQHSWMFLSSYEKLRKKVLHHETILSMLHLGPHAFEEIGGEVVQSTTYVTRKIDLPHFSGRYYRLVDFTTASGKEEGFFEKKDVYKRSKSAFGDIPGSPIAYWASDQVRKGFREEKKLGEISPPKIGMRTGDNKRFLRQWFEVSLDQIGFNIDNAEDGITSRKKWFPYNKGGAFRKWYGNQDYVVNWQNDGEEIKENTRKVYPSLGDNLGWKISNEIFYFLEGITWSKVSSAKLSVRYIPKGFIFDTAGLSIFSDIEVLLIELAV